MGLILVIEDDSHIRSVIRQMLEQAGHNVMEARDGEEGFILFKKKNADLVITDIVRPKKEGIETIVDLKAEFPEVKIIAMSGGGRLGPETYLQIADGFGSDRILTKPFSRNELLEAIREFFE